MLNLQNPSWRDFRFPEMYVVTRAPEPRGLLAAPPRSQLAPKTQSAAVPTSGYGGALGECRAESGRIRLEQRAALLAQVLGCGLGGKASGVAGPAGLRARSLVHGVHDFADGSPCCC